MLGGPFGPVIFNREVEMKKLISTVAAILLIVLLYSCSYPETLVPYKSIDIIGANALIISKKMAAITMNTVGNVERVFSKVLSNNSIEEVVIEDASGEKITGQVPDAIYEANDSYVVIVFGNHPYLVNKQNGNAFDLSAIGVPKYQNTKTIYCDTYGNLYYLCNSKVYKVSISNPASITAQSLTPDVDSVDGFAVDKDGNIIYSAFGVKRIRKTNGGLYNLYANIRLFYIGLDGYIYYQGSESNTMELSRIMVDPKFDIINTKYGNAVNGGYIYNQEQYENWMSFKDRILIVCDSTWEIFNPENQPRCIDLPILGQNRKIVKNDSDYYYVVTKDGGLYKVNPENDSYTELISTGIYDIFSFDVLNSTEVYFHALKMENGKYVFCHRDATGSIKILDEETEKSDIYIHRVN